MKPNNTIADRVRAARRCSVPIIAIGTPDPAATIESICSAIKADAPHVVWDVCSGMHGRNEAGTTACAAVLGEFDPTIGNPMNAVAVARKLPDNAILFIHLANRWLGDPAVVQAVWNLRDCFKSNHRTLVLLGPSIEPPPELAGDIVVFDEPLPGAKELEGIIRDQHAMPEPPVEVDESAVSRAVEAIQGLPAFQAEQAVALSLSAAGIDVAGLWERKRRQIELTPGLKMMSRTETFASIGGLKQVKQYLLDLMDGNGRPNAITWLDELDKALPGNTSDSSGVSQDQLGTILSYMEDNEVLGVMLLGAPGSGKSAIAKTAGNSVGVPTIRFDLGACKGSLMGDSESRIRNALRVIASVSNGSALFVATANSVTNLDSALKRRFPFIFYFDLPTREEKDAIWKIWTKRYDLKVQKLPPDDGWSAANIQKCAECAWRLRRSLVESKRYIVPCERVSSRELELLRKQADGVFLSASEEGVYRANREPTPKNASSRRIAMED